METTSAGGINKTVREIAKNLSKMGHKVTVLQANPFNLPGEEIYDKFKIIRIKSKFRENFYGFHPEIYFYLRKHFKEFNPDIVHLHGYHTLFSSEVMYILKKLMKIKAPIIFTSHYDPLNHSTFAGKNFGEIYDRIIGKKILRLPDYITSVSNYEADNLMKIFNVHDNITVIPHGVNFIDIKKERKNYDYLKLLYVGYLLDYKGVQYIIESLHELIYSNQVKNARLTIVGEGMYKEQLLLHSKKLKVSNFIEWKPFLPHAESLEEMKNADIFFLLSKSEGYGIVVAEALAMGTPVIVTNGTALEEFTTELGCFGVDYPPDPVKVSELILKIHESDTIVGPFSNKIRTWDKVIEDYESIYHKMLNLKYIGGIK